MAGSEQQLLVSRQVTEQGTLGERRKDLASARPVVWQRKQRHRPGQVSMPSAACRLGKRVEGLRVIPPELHPPPPSTPGFLGRRAADRGTKSGELLARRRCLRTLTFPPLTPDPRRRLCVGLRRQSRRLRRPMRPPAGKALWEAHRGESACRGCDVVVCISPRGPPQPDRFKIKTKLPDSSTGKATPRGRLAPADNTRGSTQNLRIPRILPIKHHSRSMQVVKRYSRMCAATTRKRALRD